MAAGCAAALITRRLATQHDTVVSAARRTGQRRPGLRAALAARMGPEETTGLLLAVAAVLVIGGGLLLAVLAVVVRRTDALAGIDSAVAAWGGDHATDASTRGLELVTALGETWMAVVVGVLVAVIDACITRSRWTVPFLLAVIVGDKLLTTGIKELVDRVRPDLNPAAAALGPSFPSGHTSTAAACWAAFRASLSP